MAKSEAYANEVLDNYLGSGTPATVYVGLYTSAPAADGTGGTEVAGSAYARKAVTNDVTNWPDAVARQKSNGTDIDFVAASGGDWGSVTHGGIFDTLSGGTPKYFGPLVDPRTILNGDAFSISTGQLVIEED